MRQLARDEFERNKSVKDIVSQRLFRRNITFPNKFVLDANTVPNIDWEDTVGVVGEIH
jgi:hypothetical protein